MSYIHKARRAQRQYRLIEAERRRQRWQRWYGELPSMAIILAMLVLLFGLTSGQNWAFWLAVALGVVKPFAMVLGAIALRRERMAKLRPWTVLK